MLYEVPREPVVTVDGAWGAPGLCLSHWPGNTTPVELRHDLSTGIALNFARLAPAQQAELARGCVALANNHYDTDGALALFAVRHPQAALARAALLLEAAEAGDMFRVPSERAFVIDRIVSGLAEESRTSWSASIRGQSGAAKHEALLVELVERLPEILDAEGKGYEDLWQPELERLRTDSALVRAATKDELVHLDLCIWTATPTQAGFDPSRHALFGSTRCDRVLAIAAQGDGWTYRFVIGTLSWFDLVSRRAPPRPKLALLAARLNELGGTSPTSVNAWRFQGEETPSPELWFGTLELAWFAEHNPALTPSRLDPLVVKRSVIDALREAWSFPESASDEE